MWVPVCGGKQPACEKTDTPQTRNRANPVVEEEDASDEDDDPLIPVWLNFPVSMTEENTVQSDLSRTSAQEQRDEPPDGNRVESSLETQNDNILPECNNLPDLDCQQIFDSKPGVSESISDGPLIVIESNFDQDNTEYFPVERVTLTEQTDETALIQHHSSMDICPDVQGEQLSVPSSVLDTAEVSDGLKRAESEKKIFTKMKWKEGM